MKKKEVAKFVIQTVINLLAEGKAFVFIFSLSLSLSLALSLSLIYL